MQSHEPKVVVDPKNRGRANVIQLSVVLFIDGETPEQAA